MRVKIKTGRVVKTSVPVTVCKSNPESHKTLAEKHRKIGSFKVGVADRFLESSSRKRIKELLEERAIKEVCFVAMIHSGLGRVGESLKIFVNYYAPPEVQIKQIAWALASTFHYNTTLTPPENYLSVSDKPFVGDFYEDFADRWAEIVDWEEVLSDLKPENAIHHD